MVNNFDYDKADGLLLIDLSTVWVKAATDFRDLRILIAVSQAAGIISDVEVQRKFTNDLYDILKYTDEKRMTALRNLMNLAADPSYNLDISKALTNLEAQGYKNNPFLEFARAAALIGVDRNIQSLALLNSSLKIVSQRFSSADNRNPFSTLSSQEAAYFNEKAAVMYAAMGDDWEFQDRDWSKRFYEMSPEEKAQYKPGDVISLTSPGPKAIGTPRPLTEAGTDLNKLNAINIKRKEMEKANDKSRQDVEPSDPEAGESSLITSTYETQVTTEVHDKKDGNKPPSQSRPSEYKSRAVLSQDLNREGVNLGSNGVMGGLALISEGFKLAIFNERMSTATSYLNDRDR